MKDPQTNRTMDKITDRTTVCYTQKQYSPAGTDWKWVKNFINKIPPFKLLLPLNCLEWALISCPMLCMDKI